MKIESIPVQSDQWRQYRGGSVFLQLLHRHQALSEGYISSIASCCVRYDHITLVVKIRYPSVGMDAEDIGEEEETLLVVLDRVDRDDPSDTPRSDLIRQVEEREGMYTSLQHWLETVDLFTMRLDAETAVVEARTFRYADPHAQASLNPFANKPDNEYLILLLENGLSYLWRFQHNTSSWIFFSLHNFAQSSVDITRPRRSIEAVESPKTVAIKKLWIDEVENRLVLLEDVISPSGSSQVCICSHSLHRTGDNQLGITPALNMKCFESISAVSFRNGVLFAVGSRRVRLETDVGECVIVVLDFRSGRIRHAALDQFVDCGSPEQPVEFIPVMQLDSAVNSCCPGKTRGYVLVGEDILVLSNGDCPVVVSKVQAPKGLLKTLQQGGSVDICVFAENQTSFVVSFLVDNEHVHLHLLHFDKRQTEGEHWKRLPVPKSHYISNLCSGEFLRDSLTHAVQFVPKEEVTWYVPLLNLHTCLIQLQVTSRCNVDPSQHDISEMLLRSMFPHATNLGSSTNGEEKTSPQPPFQLQREPTTKTSSFYQNMDDFIRTLMKQHYYEISTRNEQHSEDREIVLLENKHWMDELDVISLLPRQSFVLQDIQEILDPMLIVQLSPHLMTGLHETGAADVVTTVITKPKTVNDVASSDVDSSDDDNTEDMDFLQDVHSEHGSDEDDDIAVKQHVVIGVDTTLLDSHVSDLSPSGESPKDTVKSTHEDEGVAANQDNTVAFLFRAVLSTHPTQVYNVATFLLHCQHLLFAHPLTSISEQLAMQTVITEDYPHSRRSTPDITLTISQDLDHNDQVTIMPPSNLQEVLFFKSPHNNRLSFPKAELPFQRLVANLCTDEEAADNASSSQQWTETERRQRVQAQEQSKAHLLRLIHKMTLSVTKQSALASKCEYIDVLGYRAFCNMSISWQDEVLKLMLLTGSHEEIVDVLIASRRLTSLTLFCIRLFASSNFLLLEKERLSEIRRRSSTTSQKGKARVSLTSLLEGSGKSTRRAIVDVTVDRRSFYENRDYSYYEERRGKYVAREDIDETGDLTFMEVVDKLEQRRECAERLFWKGVFVLVSSHYANRDMLVKQFLYSRPLGISLDEVMTALQTCEIPLSSQDFVMIQSCFL